MARFGSLLSFCNMAAGDFKICLHLNKKCLYINKNILPSDGLRSPDCLPALVLQILDVCSRQFKVIQGQYVKLKMFKINCIERIYTSALQCNMFLTSFAFYTLRHFLNNSERI